MAGGLDPRIGPEEWPRGILIGKFRRIFSSFLIFLLLGFISLPHLNCDLRARETKERGKGGEREDETARLEFTRVLKLLIFI